MVEVSFMEFWMVPTKAFIQPIWASSASRPPDAAQLRAVAPLKPSTAVHTVSPEICAGYAKYRKARPVNAGLRKFLPVPPNTSLPITTPKLIPRATCHKGMLGGQIRANKMEVTKKPSFTSWPRFMANSTSQKPPTTKVTAYTGIKYQKPCQKLSQTLLGS